MSSKYLSSMEIDAIGEIQNISLGASATAVSTMLNAKVNITTPIVAVVNKDAFEIGSIDPAVCVEITYIEGLTGKNVMLLKREDVKSIVEMLMGFEIPEEEFELNEINISAICEVMNQMMGASSTALSELLSKTINISTPTSFGVEDIDSFKNIYFKNDEPMVCIRFSLSIDEKVESEFMNLMPISLAKELVRGFFPGGFPDEEDDEVEVEPTPEPTSEPQETPAGGGGTMSQEEINALMGNMNAEKTPVPQETPASGGGTMSQEEINALMGNMNAEKTPVPQETPASGGGTMSQEEINALMGNMNAEKTPASQETPAGGGGTMSQEEINALMGNMNAEKTPVPQETPAQPTMTAPAPQAQPVAPVQPVAQAQPQMQPQIIMQQAPNNEMMEQMMNMMQQQMEMQQTQIAQLQKQIAEAPKNIKVNQPPRPNLESDDLNYDPDANVDLIMGVALDVSVEIGRTQKLVKDILELNRGSLVVLDKLAGEQVDVFVNGECIAKGDVVVVEDNFGVRITEILKSEIEI